ncbi:MAG: CdaR family protein [Polyangiaceae bacterium]
MEIAATLRGAFTENLRLKFLSFCVALFFFALFHGAQDAQRSVEVNLVVLMPPDNANRVLMSALPPTLRVTLRGSKSGLEDLHADDIGNIQVDIHDGATKRITFDPSQVHVPPTVTVEQVDPPAIDLVWEDEIVRDVPIEVSVAGTPAAGFVVKGAPRAEPPTLRVRGPKSEVLVLQHVRSEALDVTGLTDGAYARHLAIDKLPGRLLPDATSQSVLVTVEVTREVVERPFVKLAVAVVGEAKGKTQPAEVDVRLVCPPEILRALRPEQVVPEVLVKSTATTGSESIPVTVAVDGCEVHVTPSSVVVRW